MAKRKAAELEDFTGEENETRSAKYSKQEIDVRFVENSFSTQFTRLSRKTTKKNGDKIIESFLKEFAEDASITTGTEAELLQVIGKLRAKYVLETDGNAYIRDMLVEL